MRVPWCNGGGPCPARDTAGTAAGLAVIRSLLFRDGLSSSGGSHASEANLVSAQQQKDPAMSSQRQGLRIGLRPDSVNRGRL
jgi:hypothetical protein